jgi:hypothetical protein
MEYTKHIDNIFSPKAKAKRIHRLRIPIAFNEKAQQVLWDVGQCFDIAEHWDLLTPAQRIQLEWYYTDKLIELIDLGNEQVNRSLPYRLRERTSEEG